MRMKFDDKCVRQYTVKIMGIALGQMETAENV